MEEENKDWRKIGGRLEEAWRRIGRCLEEDWGRLGGGLEDAWMCMFRPLIC